MFVENQEILDKRYRVIKKLGSGAFGDIYKGKQIFIRPSHLFPLKLDLKYVLVEKKKTGEFLAAKIVQNSVF